jgi:CRISPR-associated protein Cas1
MAAPVGKGDKYELPRIGDRISFLYLEHATVSRKDGSITVTDVNGIMEVPAASVGLLMLGPGISITHRAMELLGDLGCCVEWVGENGIKYYAAGQPLTHSCHLLMEQARLSSNIHLRLRVARKMYEMRFPGEDFSHMTMQQLRGREGTRVKHAYREASKRTGVEWNGRVYDVDNFDSSDDVNKALSVANACLYGLIHSVIHAIGCSPGLGFIHVGHDRSFVYDIADLYKVEMTIPLAFEIAAQKVNDIAGATRRGFRDSLVGTRFMARVVADVCYLLLGEDVYVEYDGNSLFLWDEKEVVAESGRMYGQDS